MRKLRAFVLWLALSPLLSMAASDYFFRTVDVRDGLADNFVRDITRDSHGYIWISTIHGLSRYDGYRFSNYMPQEFGGASNDILKVRESADSTLWMLCEGELFTYERASDAWKKDGASLLAALGVKGKVRAFYVDDKGNLWVATENGLFHYDYSQHRLWQAASPGRAPISHIIARNGVAAVITTDYKIYKVSQADKRLVQIAETPTHSYDRDSRVFIDRFMNLWIYNSHSLAGKQWLLSLDSRQWRQLPELKAMGNVLVNAIAEDGEGNLWVGTGNTGIQVFASHDGGQSFSPVAKADVFASKNSHISCLYLDDNNTMWVGSAKLGIAFCDLIRPSFNLVTTGDNEDVSSLLQDAQGNLWVGFDGGGIMRKTAAGVTSFFSAAQQQLPSNIVTSLAMHPDGHVMAGTYGGGIAKFDGLRFAPFLPNDSILKYVKAMATDAKGNIWVATVDKGLVKITAEGQTVHYTSKDTPLIADGTLCLTYDASHDILYIGTALGLSAYDCANGRFLQVRQFKEFEGEYVSSLLMSGNSLWIGCRNGLWVYHGNDAGLDHLTTDQGMSHDAVRALARCGDDVWASTDNGLTCIVRQVTGDRRLVYRCSPFLYSDALSDIVFSNNAAFTTQEGTALLGCYTGYLCIPPGEMTVHHPRLMVQFTEFRINGEKVTKSLNGFTIKHNERLGISVSGMVPAQNSRVKYLYRFKGEDKWSRLPDNFLFFATLRPGTHVLQVKAELPGIMESDIAELPIKVQPPAWLSAPALLLYLIIIATLLYLLYRYSQLRQKRKMAIKQMELNLKKYEMEEDKIRFFTNISHDLKTPLTLVVAPLEKIRGVRLPASIHTEVDVAWRNARQLHELVSQLLDFRRLDVGKEKLNITQGDIVDFVRQTVQGFSYYNAGKQIKMQLTLPKTPVVIGFDENKMRRIITNLLSNAFKYNTDNGSVHVTLGISSNDDRHDVALSVADTGIGVKDKHHIFDRFVQETHGQEQEGSGLGLHIVKQYVDMMGGKVAVADNKPKGTVFTVTMPVAEAAGAFIEEKPEMESLDLTNGTATGDEGSGRPTILVVDDNMDARLFLQRSLDDEYQVLLAANGKEALDILATNDRINLVVCDVMMPVMDGITFFRKMKHDISYSHIPVVFLTAKSSEENIVEGLEEGVADYITKPYSLTVLRLRIKKILEWTQHVHDDIATGIEIKPSEITVSSLDEELINRVIADIEANMQNADYSVVQLSSTIGMTRGHLYKKLMAITGKSPLEFIRIIKLKRGKSLLEQGKTNISEVADMVGYSAKQFSHYFKAMYGDTPTEFLRSKRSGGVTSYKKKKCET